MCKIFKTYWFKIWMGSVGPILINLGTYSIWGFLQLPVWCPLGSYLCKHAGDHSVTTEACSSSQLTCRGLCGMEVRKLNGPICAMFFKRVCRNPTTVLMAKSAREHTLCTPLSIDQWYIFGIFEHKWGTRKHIDDLKIRMVHSSTKEN